MKLAEYIYVDKVRVNSYFEQISPPVKYDTIPEWSVEFSITGPKGQGKQSRSGRQFTEHEMITMLVSKLRADSGGHFPNVMDSVKRSTKSDWTGFALETVTARRVILHDANFGDIAVWVCEATMEYSVTGQPLWRFLIEDYPRKIAENALACAISVYFWLFREISAYLPDLDESDFDKSTPLKEFLEKSRTDIGPRRTVDALYRVRDVSTEYVAIGGCGELYAYPIFITENPGPFSV